MVTSGSSDEFMRSGEAQIELGISKVRIAQYLKDGTLPSFRRDVNRRIKWVKRSDVAALKARLMEPRQFKAG